MTTPTTEPRRKLPAVLQLANGRIFSTVVSLAATLYLVRRLGPEPFGLLAMALGILALVRSLGDAGVGASLVSDPELSDRRIGAAGVICALLIGALSVVALLSTPLVVLFYGNDQVLVPWLVLSALTLPTALVSIPRSLAQREERFALLAWAQVATVTLGAISAVVLSQFRRDYWPLLVRDLFVALELVLLLVVLRPRIAKPQREDLAAVWHFSAGLIGSALLGAVNRNADDVLIGRILGDRALGMYTLAYRMLTFPLGQVSTLVGTVAYPRLSAVAEDSKALSNQLGIAMRQVAIISTPLALGCALCAEELIAVLFGEDWLGALVPFRILSLLSIYQAPFRLIGLPFHAKRQTSTLARWDLLSAPVIVGSFIAGLPWGITGVATSYAAACLLLAPFMLLYTRKALGIEPWAFAKGALIGISIGAAASLPAGVTLWTARHLLGLSNQGTLLAVACLGSPLPFALGLRSVWDDRPKRS